MMIILNLILIAAILIWTKLWATQIDKNKAQIYSEEEKPYVKAFGYLIGLAMVLMNLYSIFYNLFY